MNNTVTPAESSTSNKSAINLATVSQKHTNSRHIQTSQMNTETLKRFESSINGPRSAFFVEVDMENLM